MSENNQLILKSEAAVAFEGVLIAGKEFADQIERAREAQDQVAEAMAKSFGMVALQQEILSNQAAWGVIERHMGNKWGFKTDRDFGKPYPKETIVACFCEAVLDQLLPIGNEFNIIQQSTYVTKEGWRGKLERLPGVTKVDSRAGTIVDHEVREFQTKAYENKPSQTKYKMTATISATAECEVFGEVVRVTAWNAEGHDERLQLSASAEYADEVLDQLKGKVDARMLERLYWKCKGLSKIGPPSGEARKPTERLVLRQPARPVEVIDHKPTSPVAADPPKGMDGWQESRRSLNQMLSKDPSEASTVMELWDAIAIAETPESLEETGKTIGELKAHFSARVVDELRRLYLYRQQCLKEGAL